jgi:hypothetical protein
VKGMVETNFREIHRDFLKSLKYQLTHLDTETPVKKEKGFKVMLSETEAVFCESEKVAENICEKYGLDPEFAILMWG